MTQKPLSGLEQLVMDYVWSHPRCTADACREGLVASSRLLKDSTVRTLLQRLETKGYVAHEVNGRTYEYEACRARESVAAHAVKQIIDRFCGGSVEELLVGMVDNDFVDRRELERLLRKIALKKKGKN